MSFDSLAYVSIVRVGAGLDSQSWIAKLLYFLMSRKTEKKADYINSKITDVSKKELLEAIRKVQEQDKLIDEKSKFTSQSLSVRAGR